MRLEMLSAHRVTGFTLSLYEFKNTIPTLWSAVKGISAQFLFIHLNEMLSEFIALYPELVVADNAMKFISGDGGENYNLCHCAL